MTDLKITHDQSADVVEIEGIRYAGEVFRQIGSLLPIGHYFRMAQREDGVITIYDVDITAEDIQFLEWTKQHRPCHFRYYEDLQRRDAKKAAKQASQLPDEV